MSELEKLCIELVDLITKIEVSDSGNEFYPTTITSCRCMDSDRIGKIIARVKEKEHDLRTR